MGILQIAVPFMPSMGLAALVLVPVGAAMTVFIVGVRDRVQSLAPDHLRGRVSGVHALLTDGALPLSALAIGLLGVLALRADSVVPILARRPELRDVRVDAGDRVPADGRIAEARGAMLDESMALACGPADDLDTVGKSVCSFFTACYYTSEFGPYPYREFRIIERYVGWEAASYWWNEYAWPKYYRQCGG